MSIVIRQPYAHLEGELTQTFKGQKDVQVIVDRRYDERWKIQQRVDIERRQADRRIKKEEIIDIVLS